MTEPVERPQVGQNEAPAHEPREEPLPRPVESFTAVQQLREAGFSDDQQAALTTALLRVLALWTQQATRGDLHAEHQARAQRLMQQLDAQREDTRRDIGQHADALREDLRREVGQHADTLREEMRGAFAQHAALLSLTRPKPARWRDVLLWVIATLLGLTTIGVILLVVARCVGF